MVLARNKIKITFKLIANYICIIFRYIYIAGNKYNELMTKKNFQYLLMP